MGIKIVRGGLLTTVQDAGRAGYMKYGFSQCGAMDIRAMKTANILLSNDPFAAVLEMTLTGIAAVFTEDCAICISGGKIEAAINKKPIVTNKVYNISAGDVLICEKIKKRRQILSCSKRRNRCARILCKPLNRPESKSGRFLRTETSDR